MPTTSQGVYYTSTALCEPTNWVSLAFAFLIFTIAICTLTGMYVLWSIEKAKLEAAKKPTGKSR